MSKTISTTEKPGSTPSPKFRLQTFRALRYRDYRLLWISLIVSSIGTWMQIIAQSLLVLQITHGSSIALGFVALAQASSFFLFALLGGGVADRVDKRRFLLLTQSLSMLLAFIFGILTITGVIQVWMVVVLAYCSGTVLSFDQPTRTSLVPILVPKEDLMNAIALQSIVFNGTAVIGPALGGITIGLLGYVGRSIGLTGNLTGYAGNFFLNGLSYLGVLIVLYLIHIPKDVAAQSMEKRGPMLASILAALGTVKRDSVLPWILSGYAALLFFGPSATLILPIFATQGLVLSGLFCWTGSLLVFVFSRSLWLTLLALVLFGISQNWVGATVITLAQLRVPPQMRGRVMSLNTLLIMGVRPLGDFPAGALIALIGGPYTVIFSASIVGGYSLYLLIGRPVIRTLQQ